MIKHYIVILCLKVKGHVLELEVLRIIDVERSNGMDSNNLDELLKPTIFISNCR